MDQFVELLRESTIVQGILTVMIWGAIIIQIVGGHEPSSVLLAAGTVILGFYFGQKTLKPAKRNNKPGEKP